ncbi:MAG: response regulator [Candidatus Niyogibacteria bacterium]|nr:response regulator [Candidatus Niyogibacteria bacterium]
MRKNKKTVLIIEDDPWIVAPLRIAFKARGFEVLEASAAEEGLKIAERDRPDIILLDILMPRMDGFAVLELLKKDDRTRGIPVFIVSNLSSDEDVERGLRLGAKKFFVKTKSTLKNVVEEAVCEVEA